MCEYTTDAVQNTGSLKALSRPEGPNLLGYILDKIGGLLLVLTLWWGASDGSQLMATKLQGKPT